MARALGAECDSFHVVMTPKFDIRRLFEKGVNEGRANLENIGKQVSKQLKDIDIDCIVCQGSSMLPFLETDAFVCLWHDSTW